VLTADRGRGAASIIIEMLFVLRDVAYRRGGRVIFSALTVELKEGMTALVGPPGRASRRCCGC
jgi:hypothetical protein